MYFPLRPLDGGRVLPIPSLVCVVFAPSGTIVTSAALRPEWGLRQICDIRLQGVKTPRLLFYYKSKERGGSICMNVSVFVCVLKSTGSYRSYLPTWSSLGSYLTSFQKYYKESLSDVLVPELL